MVSNTDFEKEDVESRFEQKEFQGVDDLDQDNEFTLAEQKRILRKIDLRVTVTCGCMYFVSLLDRTNLGNANIAGMSKDLHLGINNRYNLVALILFVPYVIFEFPSNLVMRKVGVRNHLATICFLWGVVMLCFGFVTNWKQLVGLRVLLGVFEAGFFPGCVYLLSAWYVRYDVQKRYAVFYMISNIASAFGGVIAYGLMQMNGVANIAGWRWIFIIEGIFTCCIAAGGYCALVGFPDQAHTSWKFLTQAESQWVIRRLDRDRGDALPEPFNWKSLLAAASDPKLWILGIVFCCLTTVAYSIAYFLPLILLHDMHFSIAASQCLTAPPYIFAGILMVFCGWIGDKYQFRGPIILANAVMSMVGLAVMTYATSDGARYFGVFLVTGGVHANVPTTMAYQANNIRGQWKRAFGSATLVGFGGIGGVAGSLIFRTQDAPRYLPGIWGSMVANAIIMIIIVSLSGYFYRENKRAAAGKKMLQGLEGFFYTL